MKIKPFILSSLAFVQFAQAQDAKDVKIHNGLSTAIEQVDTDGEFLKIEKSSEMLEFITKKLDEYALPEMRKSDDVPAGFSFSKVLDLSGISDITAGSESVKKHDKLYISKQFIQTNGSRKGILALLGKADQPWASLEYAPANTSLLLETHLDLTTLPSLLKKIAPILDPNVAKKMLSTLDEKDPIGVNTLEQVLLQANARISLVVELDDSKTWGSPSQKFPAVHATGRIDGIAKFLWDSYGKLISAQLPVQSDGNGNVHTILSPKKIPSPWGELTPVVVIDTDKNHIWLSLSAEHLQSCRAGKSKLTGNKDFQKSNQHNSDQGAARLYVSKQLISLAANLLETNLKKEINDPVGQKVFKEVIQYISKSESISTTVSHSQKGILSTTSASFPVKKQGALTTIPVMASLAGTSYGPIMKHLEAADRTKDISQVKMIYSGLLGYMVQNGNNFPDNLEQVVDAGHITKKYLTLKKRQLHYVKGLSPADGGKIILYTSTDRQENVIVCFVSGATKMMSQSELEEMLEKQ